MRFLTKNTKQSKEKEEKTREKKKEKGALFEKTDRETDRQAGLTRLLLKDRQTDRATDRQADRQDGLTGLLFDLDGGLGARGAAAGLGLADTGRSQRRALLQLFGGLGQDLGW